MEDVEHRNRTPEGDPAVPEPPEDPIWARTVCEHAKNCFSRLGMGAVVILLSEMLVQLLLTAGLVLLTKRGTAPAWLEAPWMKWAMTFVPLYCLAVPAGLLVMRGARALPGPQRPLGAGLFLKILPVCLFLMYAGNLAGIAVTSFLEEFKGEAVENPLTDYVMDEGMLPVQILVMAVLAPLIEEFIFRRVLIDRMRAYGEKTAVVTSALIFGLFHGNLSQFFYAALLGLLFGWVYVRTGRLRYSVALHMFVNTLGGVVAPMLLRSADVGSLLRAAEAQDGGAALRLLAEPGVLLYLGYAFLLFLCALCGMVLFFVNLRRVSFEKAPCELPREERLRAVWVNPGMLLLLGTCLGLILWSVIS